MTTVEKLLAQIFERKKSIIEQVNHQTELYRQHLVSKCLIEGFTPPTWLWNPNSLDSEGISELNKDELISRILCSYPLSSARWSFANYPGCNNLVTVGENEEFRGTVPAENPAFNKDFNKQDDPTVPASCIDDHVGCTLNIVPELDSSATSPVDHIDERILGIYKSPDQPLAEIKRSKSRQKALKLRSSAKVKSGLGHKNANVDSSQIKFSLSARNQERQNDNLPQSIEPHASSDKCKINVEESDFTSRETGKKDLDLQGFAKAAKSVVIYANTSDYVPSQIRVSLSATDHSGHTAELPQLTDPCAAGDQNSVEMMLEEADCLSGEERHEITKDEVSNQRQFPLPDSGQEGPNDELPRPGDGGQSCEEMDLDEEDCINRDQTQKSAKDFVSSQIRISLPATYQTGKNDGLPHFADEPHAFGGQCYEQTNYEDAVCTSKETGIKAPGIQGSAKASKSVMIFENINDVVSNHVRVSLYSTDQSGQNDELSHLADLCASGEQNCEEMNLNEADCTSGERKRKDDKDVVSSKIEFSLSATGQSGHNDELLQSKEDCTISGRICEDMNLDEKECISREPPRDSAKDFVSNQISISPLATNQAGRNDGLPQFVEESQIFGGQCCDQMNFEEAVCTSIEIREKALELRRSAIAAECHKNTSDVGSSHTRFSLPATDQAGKDNDPQLTEPCAAGQSCEKNNLKTRFTRSKSCIEVPISVKGSRTLDCKKSDICHVSKARRTKSMHISHSENANTCINFSKSVGPSYICRQSCGDRRVDDANFPIKDKETNDCTHDITNPKISRKWQSGANIFSRDDNSCDNYERVDIAKKDFRNKLAPETGDGFPVEVNFPNVCNEDLDTRTSISEDSRGYSKRDCLPSCNSSLHNNRADAVSDLEASSFSAKVDEGFLAPSSGVSERQAIDSIEALQLVKPSVGLFRRLTRSQTRCNEGCDTQTSISDDPRKYCERDTLPTCRSSQQNTHFDVVSDLEASSFSANVDGGILASSSGLSTGAAGHIDSIEASGLVKPSILLPRRLTRSQTKFTDKETNQPSTNGKSPGFRSPISVPDTKACLEVEVPYQHGEVGSCYKEKNENKTSSSDVNNQQLEVSHVSSLPFLESSNSQGCFLGAVRTSHLSSNLVDTRMPGNEQCRENLHDLEKSDDNIKSENLRLSNTLVEGIISPKRKDSLHTQHTVVSPSNEDLQLADVDQSIPVFEGFIVDSQTNIGELNIEADEIHCNELNIRTTLEHASILAEMCRSASLDRPSYQFPSDFEIQESQNIYQSVPNDCNLEHLDLGYTFPLCSDVRKHLQSDSSCSDDYMDTIDGMPYSVSLAFSGARYGWHSRNQYPSPIGKLWDRPSSSYSGSSEKCLSSNPELACFPIEEDPSSNEENKDDDADDMQEEVNPSLSNQCDERKPLKDLTNLKLSVSAEEEIFNTESVDFASTKIRVTGTQKMAHCGSRDPKYQYKNKSKVFENQTSSIGTLDGRTDKHSRIGANRIRAAKKSTNNSIGKSIASTKTSFKGNDQKLSLKESTRSNIISNVTSFVPLVQQKQAAMTCAGKRDVKVKALEAARRLEKKKEDEARLKKEAIKLERAKLAEKNLRNMEIEKKKKEEERKKKGADVMARKRQREEEERKDKEKKRMRPDAKLRQREKEDKKRAEKAEKDQQINSKESRVEPTRGDGGALQMTETKLNLTGVVMENRECSTSVIPGEVGMAMDSAYISPRKEDLTQISQVKSYEISPFQWSDDEDEEDDELPAKKSIPSWASRTSVAMFLPLQQKLDPDVIFPIESFCSKDEVLLPRKQQQNQVTK